MENKTVKDLKSLDLQKLGRFIEEFVKVYFFGKVGLVREGVEV